jgi:hypothetical protein
LRFGIIVNPHFGPEVYLEGVTTCLDSLSHEHQGPRAVLNALGRIADAYERECERVRKDLAVAEGQLRDYRWQERLRAARRVFNDPEQVERIVALLESAGPQG